MPLMSGRKKYKVFHHKPFMLVPSLPSPPSLPLSLSLTHPNTHIFMATLKNQMLRLAGRHFQNYPQMFDLGALGTLLKNVIYPSMLQNKNMVQISLRWKSDSVFFCVDALKYPIPSTVLASSLSM